MRDFVITVTGIRPVPQGGMRAFRVGNRAVITHSKPNELLLYRGAIGQACEGDEELPTRNPVRLAITFMFARPKNHQGKKGVLPSAPLAMTSRPDIDKLIRSVLDGLTGKLYLDDSQVIGLTAAKSYATDGVDSTQIIVRIDDQ
jgi:Holliday junction resolvase RusA-like endonuclease